MFMIYLQTQFHTPNSHSLVVTVLPLKQKQTSDHHVVILLSIEEFTERRGRVVNPPASYLGGLRFKSQPQRLAILTEVLVAFLSPSR
jgi:hypothetical protein